MTEQNKKAFKFECREFLSKRTINRLRTYARSVGVGGSLTKDQKEELIEAIIGVLTKETSPKAPSGRGKPVMDNQPDPEIVEGVEKLLAKYDDMGEDRVPNYDFSAGMENIKNNPTRFILNSAEDFERNEDGTPRLFRGQLATQDGVSFLLPLDYLNDEDKMLISVDFIRGYKLKEGDVIGCYVKRAEQIAVVVKIEEINGINPDYFKRNGNFEDAGVCFPMGKIRVYDGVNAPTLSQKYMDWIVPFGRGNRGLVVAPPKTGKTMFLEKVSVGTSRLNEDVTTLVLLIDQSPETVMQFRKVLSKDSLVYSTYEDEPERQIFVAESILKRAKRLVECGKDVLLIIDSLSALAHAYNETKESSGGKVLPCGLESKTVHYIKKYLGAARCLELGGSLTILGGVSNMTGNTADDVIAAELSSICNLEIRLKENLAARRIFPAVGTDSVYVKYGETNGYGEPETLSLLREKRARLGDEEFLSSLEKCASIEEFNNFLKK